MREEIFKYKIGDVVEFNTKQNGVKAGTIIKIKGGSFLGVSYLLDTLNNRKLIKQISIIKKINQDEKN